MILRGSLFVYFCFETRHPIGWNGAPWRPVDGAGVGASKHYLTARQG